MTQRKAETAPILLVRRVVWLGNLTHGSSVGRNLLSGHSMPSHFPQMSMWHITLAFILAPMERYIARAVCSALCPQHLFVPGDDTGSSPQATCVKALLEFIDCTGIQYVGSCQQVLEILKRHRDFVMKDLW